MRIFRFSVALLLFSFVAFPAAAQSAPLTRADVIALVAGDALPENVEHWLKRRGVDFQFDEPTRTMLVRVGAPDAVIAAVRTAPRYPAAASAAPREALDYLVRAGDLLRHKAYIHAQKELETALRLDPNEPALYFVMGYVLRGQEKFAEALREYSALVKLEPDFPEVHTKVAYVFYRLGSAEAAMKAADRALAITPQNAEAFKNRGLAFDLQGDQDAALSEFKRALRIKPEYPSVLFNIGNAYSRLRKYDDAADAYRAALALEPNDSDYHYNLGTMLLRAGKAQEAVVALAESKRLDPNNLAVRANLAAALRAADQYSAALKESQDLVAMAPGFPQARTGLARAFMYLQRYDEALKEFQEAARLSPRDAEVFHGLGDLLRRLGRPAEAAGAYQRAADLDPSDNHFGELGDLYFGLKDWPRARAAYEKALAADPKNRNIRWLLGTVLLEMKETALALEHLRETVRLLPDDARARTELGRALEAAGDVAGARDQYRRAVRLDPLQERSLSAEAYRRVASQDAAVLAEAEALYREVIPKLEASVKHRPLLAMRLADLAAVYQAQRRFADALPLYARATQLLEADGTVALPQMEKVFRAYSQLLTAQGKATEADAVNARWERISKGEVGTNAGFDDLLQRAMRAPDLPTGEPLVTQLLELADKLPPDPNVQPRALAIASGFYFNHQRYDKARQLAQRAYDLGLERYGPLSFHTVSATDWLAGVMDAMHEYAGSEQLRLRLLAITETHPAPPQTLAHILRKLAYSQMMQRKFEQAEASLRRAEVHVRLLNDFALLDAFGRLYRLWGRLADSEKYYRSALELAEKMHGPDNPVLVPHLNMLAEVLLLENKKAEADTLQARSVRLEQGAPKK